MNALDYLLSRSLPFVPSPIVRRVASRYIAGDALQDAVRVVKALNGNGFMATLDVLGESVTRREPVERAVADYRAALDAIRAERLDANVSVKPTQLGLLIDPGLCLESLRALCAAARERGNFVRIDMEDARCTSATLEIHRRLRGEGFTNVGVVLQACMRRSLADLRDLPEGTNVRLCKGIYLEPRAVAYQDRALVNKNFVRLLEEILDRGLYAGIATHDEDLAWEAYRLIDRRRLSPSAYEFQMLLGVDEWLRGAIRGAGHRLRVYVPFGRRWRAYALRRLKENPRIAGYVLRGMLPRRRRG